MAVRDGGELRGIRALFAKIAVGDRWAHENHSADAGRSPRCQPLHVKWLTFLQRVSKPESVHSSRVKEVGVSRGLFTQALGFEIRSSHAVVERQTRWNSRPY